MDLECNNIHTCSPLTAHFNNLCCVFTSHWPTALRAERGNLLVLLEVVKYLLRFARLHSSFALECVSSNLTLQANQLCYNFLFQQSPGKYFPAHLAHLCWELTDTLRVALIQRSQSVEADSGTAVMSALLYSHSWLCHQPVNFYYTAKLRVSQLGCTNLSFQDHFITPWDSPMLFFFAIYPLDFWSVMAELWH